MYTAVQLILNTYGEDCEALLFTRCRKAASYCGAQRPVCQSMQGDNARQRQRAFRRIKFNHRLGAL